jgi:hypothetical protein
MTEPTITCPSCATEIKVTESLAAPLIEATRREYETKVAQNEREVARREAALSELQKAIEHARSAIDEQVAEKLRVERSAIAAREAKKAQLAVASDLEAKTREVADLQEVLAQRDIKLGEAQKAQADLARKQRELDEARRELDLAVDEQVTEKLRVERSAIAAREAKKAQLAVASDLEAKTREVADLQEVLAQRDVKLGEAQKAQADLARKQRELDEARRELDLIVEKRVQAAAIEIRGKAEESLKLKVTEKEEQIASMQRQIEALKRKAEQGSQQLQGEALELELETTLRARFPMDNIEPVGKGESGGDILQRVVGPIQRSCGTILWETKSTKNWGEGWLAKLRDDQRAAGADISIMVSRALPKGVETFELRDGVWITEPRFAIPLVIALRQTLIEVANSRQAQDGQETKMELVYQYLTGPKFRHRVEAIVEKFADMQADLDRERKSMTRFWAKREAQIQVVVESTVGMYGDLQGIAGSALQELEGLEVPLLEGAT